MFHVLADLAATTTEWTLSGYAMLVSASLLILGALISLVTLSRMSRPPRRYTILRGQFLLLGVLLMAFGFATIMLQAHKRTVFLHPHDVTHDRAGDVMRIVGQRLADGWVVPTESQELKALPGMSPDLLSDGWSRTMQIRRVPFDVANTGYELRSAGPDGQFDTGDDLVYPISIDVIPQPGDHPPAQTARAKAV